MVATHRVAWEAVHGAIPAGVHILHRCDVGLCRNPDHLFAGDGTTNIADKVSKDRGKKRLTLDKAKEIHALAASGIGQHKLAAMFSVNQSTISRICAGKRRRAASPPS